MAARDRAPAGVPIHTRPYRLFIAAAAVLWFGAAGPSFAPHAGQPSTRVAGIEISRDAAYLTPWALGFSIGGLFAIAVLRRRRALEPRAFAALVLSGIAFVLGAKLQYLFEELPFWTAFRFLPEFLLEPGMRMPLGLLLSGAVACTAAAAIRSSWRAVGDAWAMASSAVIPVGRIGCLLAGCCAGVECGRWAPVLLCHAHPPDSEVFRDQVAMGLIAATSGASLPTHPLPLYFAFASLVTGLVLLILLRRGAPPGALLIAFCMLWPLAKLALEPLRAEARPGILMTAIPVAVLAAVCLALVAERMRRAWARAAGRPHAP